MLLKYFYDTSLAQASYMVACQDCGEALIIDPARDITPYLKAAHDKGLRIVGAAETHIHADFVSGSRELAAQAGARLYLSDMGGANWHYTLDDIVRVKDGDSWQVGEVRVDALHTPGHTPEHLCFQITDTATADQPLGLFTGDCLFVGDVGRPDLLEGFGDSKEEGARGQFANVQRFKTLPDYLQIWPGHGAGSACGKALGALPSTTLGYEKRFNPAFQIDDEAAFVAWLLADQPEMPRYFAQMKRVNKRGAALLSTLAKPEHLAAESLRATLDSGALVIDTRSREAFAQGFVPGTLNIVSANSTYAGWFVDYDAPTYLIGDESHLDDILRNLRAIGVDDLPGYFTPDAVSGATDTLARIEVGDLAAQKNVVYILDVRSDTEYREGHITGAHHIFYGDLADHLDELPRDQDIVVQCASGVRSQIAASLLRKHDFTQVSNLRGGIEAWEKAGLPLEAST
jgi:hydroxyacylglutathione hydrolase